MEHGTHLYMDGRKASSSSHMPVDKAVRRPRIRLAGGSSSDKSESRN